MSPFSVTVLGCSSATPTNDRHPSAQVVNIQDHLLLIDCGEGTQTQIFRYGIRLGRINYILISHLHGDHFLGLPGLLSTMSLNGRSTPLVLIGPEALQGFLEHFFKVSDTQINFEIIYYSTDPNSFKEIYNNEFFEVASFPLKHRVPCTGFLLREKRQLRKINMQACEQYQVPVDVFADLKQGSDYILPDGSKIENDKLTITPPKARRFAYCSDTIYDETLVPYIKGVDLLYHEATFQNDRLARAEKTFHSTAEQAGKIAKAAEVGKLILGHFSARYYDLNIHLAEAKVYFENTVIGAEGQVIHSK